MQGGVAGYPPQWHVSLDWSEEEQRTLESCMLRFPAQQFDLLQRAVKVAAALPRKSVRDVALRLKWTAQQQFLGKRKLGDAMAGGLPGMKKPAMGGLPPKGPLMPNPGLGPRMPGMPCAGGPPLPFLPPGLGADAGAGSTVDGPISQLLESNFGILNQFRSNMEGFRVAENTQLLVQFRENILGIISHMEAMGGVMSQMPQLPVRLNMDLANTFLPPRPPSFAQYGGPAMPPPQPSMDAPGMVPLGGFGGSAPAAPQVSAPPGSAPGMAPGLPPRPMGVPPGMHSMPRPMAPPAPGALRPPLHPSTYDPPKPVPPPPNPSIPNPIIMKKEGS